MLERVVGARVEEPLPDLGLRVSAHGASFSRNEWYVYYDLFGGLEQDEEDMLRVVFVHGACVKDGSWWWHRTGELLAERGVASAAPALPSCGETGELPGAGGPGLAEDASAVRQVLTASDEPTVVVAHSYGGIVTAEAAAGLDTVRHLLLVSSYLPEVGQSLSSFAAEEPAPFLDIDPEDGTFTVLPDALAETFLHDCDAVLQREAMNKTARQSLAVLEQPVQSAAWQHTPSTYLVCAEDRGTPANRQREFAARASGVVELDAGHHPFLSQPSAVRDLILAL
jgi:pimeloyl-ACP methyl ester carboxylesterase